MSRIKKLMLSNSRIVKLMKIDKECKHNEELRKRVEPLVQELNTKPHTVELVDEFLTKVYNIKIEIGLVRSEDAKEIRSIS